MLLTVQQMQEHIAKVSYKEWKIEVREGFAEGPHIEIIALLDDSVELGKKTEFRVNSPIGYMQTIEQFNLFLLARLLRIESHETREWFKVDGKPIFYPHEKYSDRDVYNPGKETWCDGFEKEETY
jgi:hypothetical protein